MKRLLSKAWHRVGYTLVPNRHLPHRAAALFLQKLFQLLAIDCVLDVGANIGQYRDFLRRQVGYKGNIVSFEPIPANVDLLRSRAASDARWFVEAYALGSVPGEATFNVMKSTEFSSFLRPNHSKVDSFKGSNEVRQQIQVQVKTLDHVLPTLEKQLRVRNLYLKLDTQGFDLEVIRGAPLSLPRLSAMQTEVSVVPIYTDMPHYLTAIKTLEDRDFVLSGIFPNSAQFPRLIELDCYMVNRAYLSSSVR